MSQALPRARFWRKEECQLSLMLRSVYNVLPIQCNVHTLNFIEDLPCILFKDKPSSYYMYRRHSRQKIYGKKRQIIGDDSSKVIYHKKEKGEGSEEHK